MLARQIGGDARHLWIRRMRHLMDELVGELDDADLLESAQQCDCREQVNIRRLPEELDLRNVSIFE